MRTRRTNGHTSLVTELTGFFGRKNSEITGEAEEADRGSGEAEVGISSRQTASVGRIAAVNVNAIEELRRSLGLIIPWFAKQAVSKNIAYELLPAPKENENIFLWEVTAQVTNCVYRR